MRMCIKIGCNSTPEKMKKKKKKTFLLEHFKMKGRDRSNQPPPHAPDALTPLPPLPNV